MEIKGRGGRGKTANRSGLARGPFRLDSSGKPINRGKETRKKFPACRLSKKSERGSSEMTKTGRGKERAQKDETEEQGCVEEEEKQNLIIK